MLFASLFWWLFSYFQDFRKMYAMLAIVNTETNNNVFSFLDRANTLAEFRYRFFALRYL